MTDPRGATIHDLGYQRYDGPILGARNAWLAVFTQGLRAMYGLGRTAKAKVVPVFVLGVTMLQALSQVAIASASAGQAPIRYGQQLQLSLILYVLFSAAQAPEILSRDQQHRVLPLIFTRGISRTGYATARLAALVASLFLLVLACMLLLYLGQIGIATDPAKRFGEMGDQIVPVIGVSVIIASLLGSVGGAIAAWTPRRAYATAAVIALFLVLAAISSGIDDIAGMSARNAELIDPVRSLRMLGMLMFGESNIGMERTPPLDIGVYVGCALGTAAAGAALLLMRVRRMEV
jgi:ABC-2 type transport system permease protein